MVLLLLLVRPRARGIQIIAFGDSQAPLLSFSAISEVSVDILSASSAPEGSSRARVPGASGAKDCVDAEKELTEAIAQKFCDGLLDLQNRGPSAEGCLAMYTDRVHLALANGMFTSCRTDCLYDVEDPGRVAFRWNHAEKCWDGRSDHSRFCLRANAAARGWAVKRSSHFCRPAVGARQFPAARVQATRTEPRSSRPSSTTSPVSARAHAKSRSIVFNQVHKTASRTVPTALQQAGIRKIEIVPEWEGLHPYLTWRGLGHHNAFVIGTMRNPCDWYVSKWKWDCDWPRRKGSPLRGEMQKTWQRNCGGRDWATSLESPGRFRDWLVTGRYYMARLMYNNYVEEGFYNEWKAVTNDRKQIKRIKCQGRAARCRPDWNKPDPASFKPRLANGEQIHWKCTGDNEECRPDTRKLELVESFKPDLVDCWVRLSSLTEDLSECMHRWSGEPKPEREKKQPTIHAIHSLPCEAFYADDIKAGVMQMDKAIFDAFGYTTCCGAPTVDRFP